MGRWMALVWCAISATAAADPAKTVAVRADRAWTPSGLQVKRGQQLTIVARGQVTSAGMAVGPDGATATQALHVDIEASYPLASAQPLALIGRIGDGAAFALGASTRITAPRDGVLAFGINDEQVVDNTGEWSVAIYFGSPDKPAEPTTARSTPTAATPAPGPIARPAGKPATADDKNAVYCVSKVTDSKIQTICAGEQDRKKPVAAAQDPKPTCAAGEHEWDGRCVHCRDNTEYVGNGQCRVKPGPVRLPTEEQWRKLKTATEAEKARKKRERGL